MAKGFIEYLKTNIFYNIIYYYAFQKTFPDPKKIIKFDYS